MKTIIYSDLEEYFNNVIEPNWYEEAVNYLRGGADEGLFGLYLYNLIRNNRISNIINIGTARGHSAVCAAKAIKDSGRKGTVHTIDRIPPNKQRNWHVPKQSVDDPALNKKYTMIEFISRFHSPTDNEVPIKFHTGDSNEILNNMDFCPDFVFHDASHEYKKVTNDISAVKSLSDYNPMQIFDDCYLYDTEWEYRPFTSAEWFRFDELNKKKLPNFTPINKNIMAYIFNIFTSIPKKSRQYSISKTLFPGETLSVKREIENKNYDMVEIIRDSNHAPITILRD